jgi:hypothetical protein
MWFCKLIKVCICYIFPANSNTIIINSVFSLVFSVHYFKYNLCPSPRLVAYLTYVLQRYIQLTGRFRTANRKPTAGSLNVVTYRLCYIFLKLRLSPVSIHDKVIPANYRKTCMNCPVDRPTGGVSSGKIPCVPCARNLRRHISLQLPHHGLKCPAYIRVCNTHQIKYSEAPKPL